MLLVFCVVLSYQRGHVAEKLGESKGSVCQQMCHAAAVPPKGRWYFSARRFAVHASTLLAQERLQLPSLPSSSVPFSHFASIVIAKSFGKHVTTMPTKLP